MCGRHADGLPTILTGNLNLGQIAQLIDPRVASRIAEGLAKAEVTFKEGSDGREAIFGICARESWPILEMSQAAASLEEMFTKITTREVVE